MTVIYDGPMWVHYGQAYVFGDDHPSDRLEFSFAGQANGICGAAIPGCLFLIMGQHTGELHMTVAIDQTMPELDNKWEDIVEVSFRPGPRGAALIDWNGRRVVDLGLQDQDYRARYCGSGMDIGKRVDTVIEGQPLVEAHALFLWPLPAAADQVVKQSTQTAAYYHSAWR